MMKKQLPLVVIIGATACGKSKLAIDLARRFGGEIISADSMQVYHRLDIVTNKVSEEEQQLAKHHMINFLNPMNRFSVIDFRKKALNIVGDLLAKESLPIVVGGTNYYIEALLWKSFLMEPTLDDHKHSRRKDGEDRDDKLESPTSHQDDDSSQFQTKIDYELKIYSKLPKESIHNEEDLSDAGKFFKKPILNIGLEDIPSDKLWSILEQVDPESAHVFHPQDRRRVIRCLQLIQEKNTNYSDILKDVNKSGLKSGQKSLGGPLRFDSSVVLWLSYDEKLLDKVMDDRVDQMLNRGLLAELENFHKDYNQSRIKKAERPNYGIGIFQSIGFKEFHEYFMLEPDEKESVRGNEILKKCILEMKQSTRRYARRQLKWIRRRFLQQGTRDLPPVYKLTTTFDDQEWEKQVKEPAFQIVESLMNNVPLSEKLSSLEQIPQKLEPNNPGKHYCEVCDRTFIGTHYIDEHLRSRNHERRVASFRLAKRGSDDADSNVSL